MRLAARMVSAGFQWPLTRPAASASEVTTVWRYINSIIIIIIIIIIAHSAALLSRYRYANVGQCISEIYRNCSECDGLSSDGRITWQYTQTALCDFIWIRCTTNRRQIAQVELYASCRAGYLVAPSTNRTDYLRKEVMFSPVSVCLSVCLSTGLLKNYWSHLYKFYWTVGHNPAENSRRDSEWPLIKVTRRQKVKIVFGITLLKSVVESHHHHHHLFVHKNTVYKMTMYNWRTGHARLGKSS